MRRLSTLLPLVGIVLALLGAGASAARAALSVHWMPGFRAPGTPARYDKVGVLEVGPRSARNVIVLEPGTSAGSAYFVPLAQWILSRVHGWQVWSVERRGEPARGPVRADRSQRRAGAAARRLGGGWCSAIHSVAPR